MSTRCLVRAKNRQINQSRIRSSARGAVWAATAAVSLLALSHSASAQSVHTWNGGGLDDLWSNAANWTGSGPAEPDGNDEIHFAGTTRLTPSRDTAYNGYRIFFDTGAGAFTLGGNALTLFDSGANNPKIENSSTSTQTINMAITLDGNPVAGSSAEINPVNGDLVFGSTVTLADPGNTQLRIFGNNGKTVTFNGVISGDNSIAINQASNVIFKAANTYTGDTFVNAGTLQFQTVGSSASSVIRVGNISGTDTATLSLSEPTGGQTIGSTVVIRAGSSGVKTVKATNTSGTNTYSGNFFLDADVTISADSAGGTLTLSGTTLDLKNQTMTVTGSGNTNISGTLQQSTGSGKLVKSGTGLLALSATNSYTGSTTINGGTVSIAADNNLGTAPGAATDGAVTFAGGALRATSTMTLASTRNPQFNTGGGTYDVASSATLTVAGIQKGTGGYNKTGPGTLVLTSGASTVTGQIIVTGGVLQIGTSGMIGGTGAGAGTITLDGGTFRNTDPSASALAFITANRPIVIGSNGGTLDLSSTGAILALTSSTISGPGNTLTKAGPGTLRIVTPTSFTFSKLVVTGGLWQGGTDAIFGAVPGAFTADAITLNGGGISTNAGVTTSANRGVTIGASGGTFNASSSSTISGVIAGTAGGGFFKTGANAFSLTATNTYDGPTKILAGRINPNATGALGSGIVSFPVEATANGTLVNSSSPAVAVTLSNELQLNSTFLIDISANSGRSLEFTGKVTGASNWKKDNSPSAGGTGTLVLSSSVNDFAGGLTVFVGQVAVTANNALGAIAGGTTINTGASLVLRGGFDYTALEPVNVAGPGSSASTGAINSANGVNSFSGPITMAAASTVNVGADTFTLNGGIDGPGALTKSGAGMLVLGGTNTHRGGTDVAVGTLRVASDAALGDAYTGEISLAPLTVGAGYTSPPTVTINAGGGGSGATPDVVNMRVANVVVTAGGTGYVTNTAATFAGGGGATQATGTISASTGTATITGVNVATGGAGYTTQPTVSFITGTGGAATPFLGINSLPLTTTGTGYVSPPTVSVSAPTGTGPVAATAAAYVKGLITLSGGTLQTGASFSTIRPVFLKGVGGTVDTDGNDNTFSGALTGPGSLTKAGAGRLTLTGSNSYVGTTTVNAGALLVNGTHAGGAAYTVNTGGTLGGTGTISGAVNINVGGTISPGSSIGVINTGSLTLGTATAPSAQYALEVDIDGNAADYTDVTGTVTLDRVDLAFTFVSGITSLPGSKTFIIIRNDSSDAVTSTVNSFAAATGFIPQILSYAVDYSYAGTDARGLSGNGNDVAITITYVPEPASGMVMMVMAAAMLRRRRRAA